MSFADMRALMLSLPSGGSADTWGVVAATVAGLLTLIVLRRLIGQVAETYSVAQTLSIQNS